MLFRWMMPRHEMQNHKPRNNRMVKPVVYDDVREKICTGDIALYRAGWRPSNRLIARGSSTPYCHAAMCIWWEDILMLVETRQWRGGAAVTLSSQVAGWPGQWDIFRPHQPYDAAKAANAMIRLTGTPYGWGSLAYAAASHIPGLSRWYPQPTDDDLNGNRPTCSQAVSRVCRNWGGRDPLEGKADVITEPGHLAHPAFAEYKFTLFGTKQQVRVF